MYAVDDLLRCDPSAGCRAAVGDRWPRSCAAECASARRASAPGCWSAAAPTRRGASSAGAAWSGWHSSSPRPYRQLPPLGRSILAGSNRTLASPSVLNGSTVPARTLLWSDGDHWERKIAPFRENASRPQMSFDEKVALVYACWQQTGRTVCQLATRFRMSRPWVQDASPGASGCTGRAARPPGCRSDGRHRVAAQGVEPHHLSSGGNQRVGRRAGLAGSRGR